MTPSDPRLLPDLEAAPLQDAVQGSSELIGIPCDVLVGDGERHHARIIARWLDRHGRVVVQLEWHDGKGLTQGGEYIADPGRIREG